MPFGQLIFWKIIKIVATRGQILRFRCTKFYFGCGWELTALSPDSLAGFKGHTSKGREEREREEKKCRVPPPEELPLASTDHDLRTY